MRQDGRIQSYYSLRLSEINAICSGPDEAPFRLPDKAITNLNQGTGEPSSKYASTRLKSKSAGPVHLRVAVAYHNFGAPTHECRNCHAIMWYEERDDKAKRAHSAVAKGFQMARDWCNTHNSAEFHLKLHSDKKTSRQYNALTVSEVAALIVNDFGDGLLTRDVIVNRKTVRRNLYHNLCDAITQGDTSAEGLGKRIVLPKRFTCNPRYMMQNYQDAMALCRAYGNPNLFITFTSNPKWPEIAEMLAYFPGQRAHDQPEIGTQVFKIKLTQLLDDLTKNHIFGETEAGNSRHTLEEHNKCTPPSQIDDIISAKLPSLVHDPEGYQVVAEYMLHGPCGKDARYAPCKYDEKCSKLYPKSFLEETILDEDGYPNYRGIEGFKQLLTVNNGLCVTFKEACFSYGLLNDDKEWPHAISEASLIDEQIRNYCLIEILELLNRYGRSLADFQDLPCPNPKLLTNMDNRVIRDALDFDMKKCKAEHQHLHSLLNPEQRLIYEHVVESVHDQNGRFYFVYGPGGTGKTFLYKTIMARLRSEQKIVLAGASSGIASLLLPGGRTTHSRFVIPLDLMENNTCGIKQITQLAALMQEVQVKKESEDEAIWIHILEKFLIKTWNSLIEKIVDETYPYFTTRKTDNECLQQRAILTPKNEDADAINEYMFTKLAGESATYNSVDEVCKGSTDNLDQHHLYLTEFLNSLNFSGMPPYALCIKKELPIMLLRNVNPSHGLCNGTRLIITELG
ncbi:ATP-dependent DNA helicase PIF1-like protein [Tanacetum coccineum]